MRRLFKRCYVVSREVGEENVQAVVRGYHLNEGGARDLPSGASRTPWAPRRTAWPSTAPRPAWR